MKPRVSERTMHPIEVATPAKDVPAPKATKPKGLLAKAKAALQAKPAERLSDPEE
jgi:hypothetical protein